MSKTCIPCVGAVIKQAIADRNTNLKSVLEQLQDCEDPYNLDLCGGKQERAKKGERTKRAPSEYNLFIGGCMKGKNIKEFGQASVAMKECAVEWKQRKGA